MFLFVDILACELLSDVDLKTAAYYVSINKIMP